MAASGQNSWPPPGRFSCPLSLRRRPPEEHITTDRRQQLILLSGGRGLSMLTVATNHPASRRAIKSMRLGPFLVHDVSVVFPSGDVGGGTKGMPCHVSGPIRCIDGNPVPGSDVGGQ